jgi:MFS family permease
MDRPGRIQDRFSSSPAYALFLIVLLFDFADQGLLSPLLNPLLRDFFGTTVDIVPLGWISFAFTLLSAASMIFSGLYADRKSRVKICAAGALLYGISSALVIFVPHGRAGYAVFFVSRILSGIGVGAVVPSVFSLAGDFIRPDRRGTAFGFMSVAMLAGRMAGFALAGSLAEHWRAAYCVIGLVNIVLAALIRLVKEPVRGAREEELREAILEGAEYRFRISRKDIGLIREAKSNFWLIANFVDTIPGSIVLFLIFKYLKDRHNMEAGAVNVAILIVALAGALGAIVFGRVGDRGFRRDKRAKVLVALICNAVPIVFMIVFLGLKVWIPANASIVGALGTPGAWLLIFTIASAMFINQGVNPNWYASLTDINLPEHRATMISMASVMDMAGNALGPLIASYTATFFGLQTAMWSVVGFWAVNIVFWLPVLARIRGDLAHIHRVLSERAAAMKRSLEQHGG